MNVYWGRGRRHLEKTRSSFPGQRASEEETVKLMSQLADVPEAWGRPVGLLKAKEAEQALWDSEARRE
jgi:hypothetical protein